MMPPYRLAPVIIAASMKVSKENGVFPFKIQCQ